jgi:hypothetical protein
LFNDNTFEFLPPSDGPVEGLPTFSSFKCQCGRSVEDFVPRSYLDQTMHNDPEFETFTFGDRPGTRLKTSPLRLLKKGDSLFFLARLVDWDDYDRWGRARSCLIGKLVLDRVLLKTELAANLKLIEIVKKNIHVMRWQLNPSLERRNFWIFVGSEESSRFRHAVPFDDHVMARVLRASDEETVEEETVGYRLFERGDRACCIIDDGGIISNLENHIGRNA